MEKGYITEFKKMQDKNLHSRLFGCIANQILKGPLLRQKQIYRL